MIEIFGKNWETTERKLGKYENQTDPKIECFRRNVYLQNKNKLILEIGNKKIN